MIDHDIDEMIDHDIDEKLDRIYDKFDVLCREGRFTELDTILKHWDVDAEGSYVVVGLMTSTFSAREHLKERPGLVERCEARLRVLCPEQVRRRDPRMRR
jgi:hypothetical protein